MVRFLLVMGGASLLTFSIMWLRWRGRIKSIERERLAHFREKEERRFSRFKQRKRGILRKIEERARTRMLRDETRLEDYIEQEERDQFKNERLGDREIHQAERIAELTQREDANQAIKNRVHQLKKTLKEHKQALKVQLEERAQLSSTDAKDQLISTYVMQSEVDAQQRTQRTLVEAEAYKDDRAAELMSLGRQRYYDPQPAERLLNYVEVPKSKISESLLDPSSELLSMLKEVTHVEFIADEHNPQRLMLRNSPETFSREVARLTFQRWINTNQLSSESLKKQHARALATLEEEARRAGQAAAARLDLKGIHPEILHLVGKLLFRTSYTQNQWQHAIEAAELCGMMAEELKMDVQLARRATLLHDIGKVLWEETEAAGSHAVSGAVFAREHGEPPEVVHPINAHHHDEAPATPLAFLVIAADTLSGARPGARRETSEAFSQHVTQLDELCGELSGIRQHMIIQGGREVRLQVYPQKYDDFALASLSEEVAMTIEEQCVFPGQIKVTALREVISSAVARARWRDQNTGPHTTSHQATPLIRASGWGGERGIR